MIKRVLVDSDVILDVGLAREPFLQASRLVLALLENGRAVGCLSSNSITNISYILRKAGGDPNARLFIGRLLKYMTVVSVGHTTILSALQSDFGDFEDAVQHESAMESQCNSIVTRNGEHYKRSKVEVYSPQEYLREFL